MILKIDNKGCSEDENFETEFDFIVNANQYYHEHCTFEDDYDTNYTIVGFEEAKRLFEIEDYTIKTI